MREPLLRFLDRRNVSRRHPPQRQERAVELLEPRAPSLDQFRVSGAIDVTLQRLDVLPDREVEEDPVVVVRTEIRGVARFGLQPPDEAVTAVGQGVDLGETRDEPFHDWRIERCLHSGDIDLRKLVLRHVRNRTRFQRRVHTSAATLRARFHERQSSLKRCAVHGRFAATSAGSASALSVCRYATSSARFCATFVRTISASGLMACSTITTVRPLTIAPRKKRWRWPASTVMTNHASSAA